MRHLASILQLSALALLCGCGGGEEGSSNPPPQGLNIAGNWQFSMTSSAPGTPLLGLAGSIGQSDNSLNGAVHVDGSNCLDPLTTVSLTGTLNGSTVSLTSAPVDGQVIALDGSITNGVLTGTYSISGSCANDDQGNVTGFKVRDINGIWKAIYDINGAQSIGEATMTQASADSEGSFGLTGTSDDESRCFAGTITPGTFPSPSFIMGTSVAFEIKASGGNVVFDGTMNEDGTRILGSFHVIGGPCNDFVTFGFACFLRDRHGTCSFP